MDPILTVAEGPQKGRVFFIPAGRTVMGRDPTCQLRLDDTRISRNHAEVVRLNADCELVDLQSTNGTLVNGERVNHHTLADGDVIQVGGSTLRYHVPRAPLRITLPGASPEETQSISIDARGLSNRWPGEGDEESLRRAKLDLEALYRAGRSLSGLLETSRLAPRIADTIFAELEHVDRVALHLMDPQTGKLTYSLARCRPSIKANPPEIFSDLSDQVVRQKRAVLTYDLHAEGRSGRPAPVPRILSCICTPLQTQDKMIGILYTDTILAGHRLTRDDLRLLAAIGLQAGAALENARLYERLAYEKAALDSANQQLKSAQERLIQSEKLAAIGRLASGIVHDLKSPMMVILGYTSLVKEKMERQAPEVFRSLNLGEYLNDAEKGIHYCNEIIQRLLKFASPSPLTMAPVRVDALLEETVKFIQFEINKAGTRLDRRIASDLPEITADANQIKQVFMNLILNALQAMNKSDRILRIEAAESTVNGSRHLRISFEDNGKGMSASERSRIFEPFFTTRESGTGLGLSICYGIVDRHGGVIEVESRPGRGSTFSVLLPITPPAESK